AVFHNGFEKSRRFNVLKDRNTFILNISNAEPSDSATYYCSVAYYTDIALADWTVLVLKDAPSSHFAILQHPVSAPVELGGDTTLQCSVLTDTSAGEHSVYWFRHGSGESHPGIIYTHGNRSDQCKSSSETDSSTQSCVYKLPKRNLSLSDAGTYYCAVLMCGEIILGNGTKLDFVAAVFHNGFEKSRRFNVLKDRNTFILNISNAEPSDSATYYCSVAYYTDIALADWTVLVLKGSPTRLSAVLQHPVSDPVELGGDTTLQCSVLTDTSAGEHSVYWFRHGSGESHPGIIYTHGNRSDQCKSSSETDSSTQSCVYKLPKRNLSLSDAGTYYCAVLMCGEIIFGSGTKLDFVGKIKYLKSTVEIPGDRQLLLDNGTLTAIRYQDEILGPVVKPYAGAVGPGFLLVHNNARPHVARVCRQFLENEGIDTIDGPTGSPDLNPIEHLRDIMFLSIRRHQ
ncbi:hypothetical protein NFI96_031976, partial [Prochilodus magdalenae]